MSFFGQFSVCCVSSAASEADQFQRRQKLESATLGNFFTDTFLEQTQVK